MLSDDKYEYIFRRVPVNLLSCESCNASFGNIFNVNYHICSETEITETENVIIYINIFKITSAIQF